MTIKELESLIVQAMRDKAKAKLQVLRALKTAYINIVKQGTLEDKPTNSINDIIVKQIKQRKDSYDQFSNAGRHELASVESFEIGVLERMIPEPPTIKDLRYNVEAAILMTRASDMRDMGVVMAALNEFATNNAVDRGALSKIARGLLTDIDLMEVLEINNNIKPPR